MDRNGTDDKRPPLSPEEQQALARKIPRLRAYIRRQASKRYLSLTPEDIEDLAQEVLLKEIVAAGPKPFAWEIVVVRRMLQDFARWRHVRSIEVICPIEEYDEEAGAGMPATLLGSALAEWEHLKADMRMTGGRALTEFQAAGGNGIALELMRALVLALPEDAEGASEDFKAASNGVLNMAAEQLIKKHLVQQVDVDKAFRKVKRSAQFQQYRVDMRHILMGRPTRFSVYEKAGKSVSTEVAAAPVPPAAEAEHAPEQGESYQSNGEVPTK